MNGSDIDTTRTQARPLQPATVGELLDHEEALAVQRLRASLQQAGEDLCAAIDLRPSIRRHPILATGLGAALGFAGGPLLPRAFRWIVTAALHAPTLATQAPVGASGFVMTALRGLRTLR